MIPPTINKIIIKIEIIDQKGKKVPPNKMPLFMIAKPGLITLISISPSLKLPALSNALIIIENTPFLYLIDKDFQLLQKQNTKCFWGHSYPLSSPRSGQSLKVSQ